MHSAIANRLLNEYAICQQCGSDKFGNEEGSVEIHDDTFKRTCKCGWVVVYKED